MQREGIEYRGVFGKNGAPRNLPGFRNQVQGGGGQGRRMQRLANVAGGIRTAGVLVYVCAASSEIQQREAAHQGERAPS